MLAGNVIPVASVKLLSELFAVPNTLWCYTVFVVQVELVVKVQAIVAAHKLCMASKMLNRPQKRLLL